MKKDYKPVENVRLLLKYYNLVPGQLVLMNQVHNNHLVEVGKEQGGCLVKFADGLVTTEKGLFLSVKAADCVPLFFYDPQRKIVAVAHAGWRGTLGKISLGMVKKMQSLGSDPKDVFVAIGPHIGGCCYSVETDRAEIFIQEFKNGKVVFKEQGVWHLDLGQANKIQLFTSNITELHIDAPVTCTSCQNDRYYSYRKDSQETFGEMLGFIGIKN